MEVESLGHGDREDDEMGLEKTFSNDSLEMFPSCWMGDAGWKMLHARGHLQGCMCVSVFQGMNKGMWT